MAPTPAPRHESTQYKTAGDAHRSCATASASTPPQPPHGMWVVRYGIGAIMVLGGIVVLVVSPAGLGTDGFAMAAGGGSSVLLINYMYRLSLSSEVERLEDEQARRYFDGHGEWPDDPPPRPENPLPRSTTDVRTDQDRSRASRTRTRGRHVAATIHLRAGLIKPQGANGTLPVMKED
jgi:hypothetical protein